MDLAKEVDLLILDSEGANMILESVGKKERARSAKGPADLILELQRTIESERSDKKRPVVILKPIGREESPKSNAPLQSILMVEELGQMTMFQPKEFKPSALITGEGDQEQEGQQASSPPTGTNDAFVGGLGAAFAMGHPARSALLWATGLQTFATHFDTLETLKDQTYNCEKGTARSIQDEIAGAYLLRHEPGSEPLALIPDIAVPPPSYGTVGSSSIKDSGKDDRDSANSHPWLYDLSCQENLQVGSNYTGSNFAHQLARCIIDDDPDALRELQSDTNKDDRDAWGDHIKFARDWQVSKSARGRNSRCFHGHVHASCGCWCS